LAVCCLYLKRNKEYICKWQNTRLINIDSLVMLNEWHYQRKGKNEKVGTVKEKIMHSTLFMLLNKTFVYVKRQGVRITVHKILEYLRTKAKERRIKKGWYSKKQLEEQRQYVFEKNVKFSILVPLYNTPVSFLHEMIESVRNQTYGNWELCLADGSDAQHAEVEEICRAYGDQDKRIRYVKLEQNMGISGNTNACISMATGEYIALFDHDDLLHPAALYENMRAICEQHADFIYTDEVTFESPDVNDLKVFHFKPDYARDNLRANNYICHFSVFSKELLERAGEFRPEYDGSQDHELILRLTAQAKKIVHIPRVLYYWRSHPQSVAQDINSKTYAIDAGKRAVRDHVASCGLEAEVESSRAFPSIYRIKYKLKKYPLVSILILNDGNRLALERCVDSILKKTTYPKYEIVIGGKEIDDLKCSEENDQRIRINKYCLPENGCYSECHRSLAASANGEYYILLDSSTEIITPEWIEEMLMYVQQDDVAAAGAILYDTDDTMWHAGIVLGLGPERAAGYVFKKKPREYIGYMGNCCYARNVSAVSDACMMIKAVVYKELEGYDDAFGALYADIDLCMRMREKGYLIVWTPYAELYQYEPIQKKNWSGSSRNEANRFRARWKDEIEKGDPYYNPNFSLDYVGFHL